MFKPYWNDQCLKLSSGDLFFRWSLTGVISAGGCGRCDVDGGHHRGTKRAAQGWKLFYCAQWQDGDEECWSACKFGTMNDVTGFSQRNVNRTCCAIRRLLLLKIWDFREERCWLETSFKCTVAHKICKRSAVQVSEFGLESVCFGLNCCSTHEYCRGGGRWGVNMHLPVTMHEIILVITAASCPETTLHPYWHFKNQCPSSAAEDFKKQDMPTPQLKVALVHPVSTSLYLGLTPGNRPLSPPRLTEVPNTERWMTCSLNRLCVLLMSVLQVIS